MTTDHKSIYFLHGLESSGNGTKGTFFAERFPQIKRPDFDGDLAARLEQLEKLSAGEKEITLIGSSFGGLMAACFTENNRERVRRLILMAPALNFADYAPPRKPIAVPTLLLIGRRDDVTPIDPVVSLAQTTFSRLTLWINDDDHMLHNSFELLNWEKLLNENIDLSSLTSPFAAQHTN